MTIFYFQISRKVSNFRAFRQQFVLKKQIHQQFHKKTSTCILFLTGYGGVFSFF